MSKKENKSTKRADKITAKLEAKAEAITHANEEMLRRDSELYHFDYEVIRENFKLATLARLKATRDARLAAINVGVIVGSSVAIATGAVVIKGKRIMKEHEAQNQ